MVEENRALLAASKWLHNPAHKQILKRGSRHPIKKSIAWCTWELGLGDRLGA